MSLKLSKTLIRSHRSQQGGTFKHVNGVSDGSDGIEVSAEARQRAVVWWQRCWCTRYWRGRGGRSRRFQRQRGRCSAARSSLTAYINNSTTERGQ